MRRNVRGRTFYSLGDIQNITDIVNALNMIIEKIDQIYGYKKGFDLRESFDELVNRVKVINEPKVKGFVYSQNISGSVNKKLQYAHPVRIERDNELVHKKWVENYIKRQTPPDPLNLPQRTAPATYDQNYEQQIANDIKAIADKVDEIILKLKEARLFEAGSS